MTHNPDALATILVALCAVVAFGSTTTSSPSANFNTAPIAVYDITATDDALFVAGSDSGVTFVPGTTNDTIYVYLINWTDATTDLNIIRRTLNASTVATINGTADENVTTSLLAKTVPKGHAGLGYLAFVTITGTTQKLNLNTLSGTATSVTTTEISGNSDSSVGLTLGNVWYEDGYFYVVYTTNDGTNDTAVYLQAVSGSGTKLWASPINVANISIAAGTSMAMGGSTNYTNSTYIFVAYKDEPGTHAETIAILVNKTDGSLGAAQTLATDTTEITYAPAGFLASWSTYGVAISSDDETNSSAPVYTVDIYYNGSTDGTSIFTTPSDATSVPVIAGINYNTGYVLFASYGSADGQDMFMQEFYYNGTENLTSGTSQLAVGTFDGSTTIFADANGTLWMGYSTYDTADDTTVKGYLGVLLGQIYKSGNILAAASSFFGFLALLIVALFAF